MTLIVKPRGRGNWTPRTWTIEGIGMAHLRPGMVLEMGGVLWRVCEVRPCSGQTIRQLPQLRRATRAGVQLLRDEVMTTPVTGCSGKKVYRTFTQASRGARRLRERQDDSHVEAYHCRHCNRFHVGEARSYGHIDKRKDIEL